MNEPICIFCGHILQWDSDFDYNEIYDGDGIIRYYHCPNCNAEAEYSKKTEEEDNK